MSQFTPADSSMSVSTNVHPASDTGSVAEDSTFTNNIPFGYPEIPYFGTTQPQHELMPNSATNIDPVNQTVAHGFVGSPTSESSNIYNPILSHYAGGSTGTINPSLLVFHPEQQAAVPWNYDGFSNGFDGLWNA